MFVRFLREIYFSNKIHNPMNPLSIIVPHAFNDGIPIDLSVKTGSMTRA